MDKNKNKISLIIFSLGAILLLGGLLARGMGMRFGSIQGNGTNDNFIQREQESSKELPIPVLLEDENPIDGQSDFTVNATEGFTDFYENSVTPTMGYNGSFLGPVIKVEKGDLVNMKVNNELSDSTSVHWHGLEVEGPKDGGPRQVIPEGETWTPSFTIEQPAATLWFHPHVMGTTATQVYKGLAGMLIVEDEESKNLNIPQDYGINDIPLILQDRSFNQDGSFSYGASMMMMDGMLGDTQLVNGAITPNLEVEQIKMRFRILNGSNARNYSLTLGDDEEFHQIASDGGFLEKPVAMNDLFISPGERAEVIMDFSKFEQGDIVRLMNGQYVVMTFTVGDKGEDRTVIPEVLTQIEPYDEEDVVVEKSITLDGAGRMVSINGKKFDLDRIDDQITKDTLEIWEVRTEGAMMMGSSGHPFHIHSTQFQVLSRNGREPDENEKGWKDTIFVGEGDEVRLLVKFKHEGIFMYHCHILEHEEDGMMAQIEVIEE